MLTSTDTVFGLTSIPLIDITVNAMNGNARFRKVLESTTGIHHEAPMPRFHSKTLRKQVKPLLRDIHANCRGRDQRQARSLCHLLRQLQQSAASVPTLSRSSSTTACISRSCRKKNAAACRNWNWATWTR